MAAEIFGTVSGAIGVAGVTAHAVRILIDDIDGIIDAPKTIQNVKTELVNVQSVLESLDAAFRSDGATTEDFRNVVQSKNVEKALVTCRDSCDEFKKTLGKWLKHSKENGLDWRDKLKVGFFGEKKLAVFKNELNICKSTISLALNSANFLAACEQHKKLQELIQQEAARLPQNTAVVAANTGSAASDTRPEEEIAQLKPEVDKAVDLMDSYQTLLGQVVAQVEQKRTNLTIGTVNLEGKGLVGIHSKDGDDGQLDVKMQDVTIGKDAKGAVGYSKGIVQSFSLD